MLYITNHQENAHQNHNKIYLTVARMAKIKNTRNNCVRIWRNGNPCALLVGAVTVENNMKIPQKIKNRGICVAQSVRHLTLGFGQVMILRFHEFEPRIRLCPGNMEPAWDSLSLPFSLPTSHLHCLCLSQNKFKKLKKN